MTGKASWTYESNASFVASFVLGLSASIEDDDFDLFAFDAAAVVAAAAVVLFAGHVLL